MDNSLALSEKDLARQDEKLDVSDVEHQLQLSEEEDSPIEEVRITVPSKSNSIAPLYFSRKPTGLF